MNKLFLFSLIALLALISCQNQGLSPTNCRDGKCVYRVLQDKEILLQPDSAELIFRVEEGDKLLFRYEYTQNEVPRIADDEYLEWLMFEIDKDQSSFSFKDTAMKDAKFLFYPSCECIPGNTLIEAGTLEGRKISDTQWEVSMDVSFSWGTIPQERKVDAIFEME